MAASSARTKVFISYSHKNKAALERLKTHLAPYLDMGVDYWEDSQILPGSEWFQEIQQALAAARVAILLVSADFLASQFIKLHELRTLLEAARRDGVKVFPVILSPSAFEDVPGLGNLQALNNPATPLLGLSEIEQDKEWLRIARTIYKALLSPEDQANKKGPAPQPEPVALPLLMIFSIAGNVSPQRVMVPAAGMSIGREHTNTLPLAETSVSRHHLQLSLQGTRWEVTRLPTAGPLYVNGHLLDQAVLQPHDQLVIGGVVLRFESTEPRFAISNIGTEQLPLLITPERVPHLTVTWAGGRFVALLREQAITLGRAPDCGIVVPADIVGSHHARLERLGDGSYHIHDLNSRNGLLFQGTRIKERYLQHGDRLLIGAPDTGQMVMLAYALPR